MFATGFVFRTFSIGVEALRKAQTSACSCDTIGSAGERATTTVFPYVCLTIEGSIGDSTLHTRVAMRQKLTHANSYRSASFAIRTVPISLHVEPWMIHFSFWYVSSCFTSLHSSVSYCLDTAMTQLDSTKESLEGHL